MKWWLVAALETNIEWPTVPTSAPFEEQIVELRPPQPGCYADVCTQYDHPGGQANAIELVCRFLSIMSWKHRSAARIIHFGFGTLPNPFLASRPEPISNLHFRLPSSIEPPSHWRAKLALALYREAISLQGPAYAFLGFARVINILYRRGVAQKQWINRTIPLITDREARDRIAILAGAYADVGEYLYDSGRCAIAHAFGSPVVDPDNPNDILRLMGDLIVVRALAEYLIEHELGVA
jgi:hypothetical protein